MHSIDAYPHIAPFGDCGAIMRFAGEITAAGHMRAIALLRAYAENMPDGVLDMILGYVSLGIYFDPQKISFDAIAEDMLVRAKQLTFGDSLPSRLVTIPVNYGGAAGPDLALLAESAKISVEQAVELHAKTEYTVYFLGFIAGFPYMGEVDPKIRASRRSMPRKHIPRGSVGVADAQTGIYSVASPGGWNIIGSSQADIFDPLREQPFLLLPGDRARFTIESIDIASQNGADFLATDRRQTAPRRWVAPDEAVRCAAIIDSGTQTCAQGARRHNVGQFGVSRGGAADFFSLRAGNLALGNHPDACALEFAGIGPELKFLCEISVIVTGAAETMTIDGYNLPAGRCVTMRAGQILRVGETAHGARGYICFAGGIAGEDILGADSTDIRGGFGGIGGRYLCVGDMLSAWKTTNQVVYDDTRIRLPIQNSVLRVLPGPDFAAHSQLANALTDLSFVVSQQSDRMGICLESVERQLPEDLIPLGNISEMTLPGALQVPPGGKPMLLGADCQTTGGYCVPLAVISADIWRIGQLCPGMTTRFTLVSLAESATALRQTRQAEQSYAVGVYDTSRLFCGFVEGDLHEEMF